MEGKLVSPNELLEAARGQMLRGREPETKRDWTLVMNFMAANVAQEVRNVCCKLLARIYDMPLTDREVDEICDFHTAEEKRRLN